jgi:hypothetical protein
MPPSGAGYRDAEPLVGVQRSVCEGPLRLQGALGLSAARSEAVT